MSKPTSIQAGSLLTRALVGSLLVPMLCSSVIHPSHRFILTARAQTDAPAARKIDEFGDVYPTDMAARLDNFAVEVQSSPGARGFMIVYRSHRDLPGLSSRHVNWMKNYLIHNRGVADERIAAVDGGEASCLWHELWVVQPGATLKPRPDAYSRGLNDAEAVRKYDEYNWDAPHDEPVSFSTEYSDTLDGFAQALRKEPRSQAYIIAYAEYYIERREEEDDRGRKVTRRRVLLDPPGTALKKLNRMKATLAKRDGVAPSRIKIVDGGYRRIRQLELWIVPRGERAPIPTPNAFPKGRGR